MVKSVLAAFVCTLFAGQALAFDFAISNFRVLRDGSVLINDTFNGSQPPSGPSPGYTVLAGVFSPAVNGKLKMNSAAAGISPAVSSKMVVAAQFNTSKSSDSTGIKPGHTFEVSAIWDAIVPNGPDEAYSIELGDWGTVSGGDQNVCYACIKVGVYRETDGSVNVRFWRDSISNNAINKRTILGAVPFSPGTNQQVVLRLVKESATSNAVTAYFAYINNGVEGVMQAVPGTATLFDTKGYALATFRAGAPVAYTSATGTNQNLSLTSNINVDNKHAGKTGNIYVVAVYKGSLFANDGSSWVYWPGTGTLPAYATNVTLADQKVDVVKNIDLSQYSGLQVLVGYGTDVTDVVSSNAFETVYTVP